MKPTIIKPTIIRALLRLLNSRWLNSSPCQYGYIGNVDAFSIEYLQSEERQRPGITVAQVIHEAEMFRCCPMRKSGVTVIEGNERRDADVWDLHELGQALTPEREARR